MAFAREIFIQVKRIIRFQQSEKEKDSHYTVLGNTLVRISNHCTHLSIWDNFLEKNSKMKGKKIISIVFEDNGRTFSDECLYLRRYRRKPIKVEEIVYPINGDGKMIQGQEIKSIINDLQNIASSGQYADSIGKGQRYVRISINPSDDTQNATDIGNSATYRKNTRFSQVGGNSMRDKIKENRRYNMKKRIRLTEGDLHRIIRGCVNEALNELDSRTYASYALGRDLQRRGLRQLSKATQKKLRHDYDLWDASEEGREMAIDAWNRKYGEPHRFMTDRNGDYVITSEYRGPIDNASGANFFGMQRDYYPKLDMIGTTTQCGWAKDCNKPNSADTYQRFEPVYDPKHYDEVVARQMANPNPKSDYRKGSGWKI
jgi:hypothetical protein